MFETESRISLDNRIASPGFSAIHNCIICETNFLNIDTKQIAARKNTPIVLLGASLEFALILISWIPMLGIRPDNKFPEVELMENEERKDDETLDSYLRDPWSCYEDDDSACYTELDDSEEDCCCCCCL
jgi:hypothetical protein